MSIQLLLKIFSGLVLAFIYYPVAAQNPCDYEPMEERINQLIKSHESLLEDEKFVEIDRFYVRGYENYSTIRKDKPFIFSYLPVRTFRFYVLTAGKSVQLTLRQIDKGSLRNHVESKVLFQTVQESSNAGIEYYDYLLEEKNDFQLSLTSQDNSQGCAVMVFVVIAPKR